MLHIVHSVCNRDAALMLKNVRWQRDMQARDFPAVLSVDPAVPEKMISELMDALGECYRSVEFYRYPYPQLSAWPQAPNHAFQHTARFMQQLGSPWLWLEADAIPTQSHWRTTLSDEYQSCGKPFMGCIVPDYGHCNGVAIYPANTPDLIPKAMVVTDVAWDNFMREEMIAFCHPACHLMQSVWGIHEGKFHPWQGPAPSFKTEDDLKNLLPNAVLFHRNKDGSLIDRLRERARMPMEFCQPPI